MNVMKEAGSGGPACGSGARESESSGRGAD